MRTSSNQEHFFETDASQARRKRKDAKAGNKHGNAIALQSKLNAVIADPAAPYSGVLVAESAGNVRRINVETGETGRVYRGPKAPLACVATGGGKDHAIVFAGCWDKAIWSWDLASGTPARKYEGHSDFVKAVVCVTLAGTPLLVSGGADKKIMVWEVETGKRLHVLQDTLVPMMAVQHLVVDPVLTTQSEVVIVSAGSDPHIRRWKISLAGTEKLAMPAEQDGEAERDTILEHETGVFRLHFDTTSEDCDLWTASADGTAKCLARARGFAAEEVLKHGDYVRAVAGADRWVVTAGRSEDVKVWDRVMGDTKYVLQGHYDEVSDMVLLRDGLKERLVSVGIDGTVRRWDLVDALLEAAVKEMGEGQAEKPAEAEEKAEKEEEEEKEEKEEKEREGVLTAEEEAELAELMDDDD